MQDTKNRKINSIGKKILVVLVCGLMGMGVLGCARGVIPGRQIDSVALKAKTQLVLYCGAGIRKPVGKLVHTFECKTGLTMHCRFGGSGKMFQECIETREGDVYMAGTYYIDKAAKDHLVVDSRTVCYVRPAILVAKGNPKNISSLYDLARPGTRMFYVDPAKCQLGLVVESVLEKNKVDIKSIQANVVRALPKDKKPVDWLHEGLLDAVLVWDSRASGWLDKADIIAIPDNRNEAWPVRIALFKFSKHQNEAKRFMKYLAGRDGQTVFKQHHFRVDGPE